MTRIEPGVDGFFRLNGIPYQRGAFRVKPNGQKISIVGEADAQISEENIANLVPLENWRDENNKGFSSLSQFLEYLEGFFYSTPNESGTLKSIEAKTGSSKITLENIYELLLIQNEILKSISE